MLADGWKAQDMKKVAEIYYKSNITLTTIGWLLFLGLAINLDNVFEILGPQYEAGRWVVVFIGLANFFEMSTSVSQNVIHNSEHYKVLTWLLLLFVGLLVVTNLIFIPVYGIVGAAFASAISRFIFNFLSWLFLLRKYQLQPFDHKYIILIMIGLVSFGLAFLLPKMAWFGWDILLRSALFTASFGLAVYFFRISEDINQALDEIMLRVGFRK